MNHAFFLSSSVTPKTSTCRGHQAFVVQRTQSWCSAGDGLQQKGQTTPDALSARSRYLPESLSSVSPPRTHQLALHLQTTPDPR